MLRRPRKIRVLALLLVAALGLLAAFLFVPPPRAIVRGAALMSSTWLLSNSAMGDGRLVGKAKLLVNLYVQLAVASQVAGDLGLRRAGGDEVADLARILTFVRAEMINPHQVAQAEGVPYPALVRGLGYCDQVNAAVGMIAAHRFEKAELFALLEPAQYRSPHTIGRVWSGSQNTWLYFDAFYTDAKIFTKDAQRRPRYLDASALRVPGRGLIDPKYYAYDGIALVDFPTTMGGYLLSRLRGSVTPPPPLNQEPVSAAPSAGSAGAKTDDAAFRGVASAYVAARVDDLLGARSADAYRRIAADPRAQRDPRAANIAELAGVFAKLRERAPVQAP